MSSKPCLPVWYHPRHQPQAHVECAALEKSPSPPTHMHTRTSQRKQNMPAPLPTPPPFVQITPTLPSFPPPKPYLVLRDTLCSCEAYGMRPMYTNFLSTHVAAGSPRTWCGGDRATRGRVGGTEQHHYVPHIHRRNVTYAVDKNRSVKDLPGDVVVAVQR